MAHIERSYTMGEVVRETGVPAATLRAWERRYGVPCPERSAGRHRLYSEEDVALLKWLISRHQAGISISRAIAAWRQMEGRGVYPVRRSTAGVATSRRHGRSLDMLRDDWIDACLGFDRRQAQSITGQAFALYPVEEVCRKLLQQGLSEIGEAWQQGNATVQQEHFASSLAMHQVERLIGMAPSPWRKGRVLLACPPEEQHTFPLLLLALLLRQHGWDTIFLGASVPLEGLDATVELAKPTLSVLAAQRLATTATLMEMARLLQGLDVRVGYGGLAFNVEPALRQRVVGCFLGEDLWQAPSAIEEMIEVSLHSIGTVVA